MGELVYFDHGEAGDEDRKGKGSKGKLEGRIACRLVGWFRRFSAVSWR